MKNNLATGDIVKTVISILVLILTLSLVGCGSGKVKEVSNSETVKNIEVEKERLKREVVEQTKPGLDEVNQHRKSASEYIEYVPNMELADRDVKVLVDGEEMTFINEIGEVAKAEAFILKGRTFIPFRVLAESIGAEVGWITESQTVSYYKDGTSIKMTLGYEEFSVNDEFKVMDTPPFVIDGKTYVPLRFIIENLSEITISWSPENKTVIVNTGKNKENN